MIRTVLTVTCALALLGIAACGNPPGALQARLHWPNGGLRAAPVALDEIRFVIRGGDGFAERAAVSASAGAWRSPPLAAGLYRLEALAMADGRALLRAVTDVSVRSDQVSLVELQMGPLE